MFQFRQVVEKNVFRNSSIIAVVACISLCAPSPAWSADPQAQSDAHASAADNAERGGHKLAEAYDGWQLEYGGFSRTPILFDPIPTQSNPRKRVYPQLSKLDTISGRSHVPDYKANTFRQVVNLSVDDTIRKSKMATFQSVANIQDSHNADTKARDRHLALFSTLRGVAVLTLSYLDKTVAAGLATVQQQSDMDSLQQLLKQISWTNSKIANMNRSQLYNDVDEKFEACMINPAGAAAGRDDIAHVRLECPQCAAKYSQESKFHYCACCAEESVTVNSSTPGDVDTDCSASSNAPCSGLVEDNTLCSPDQFSLIGRLFYGLKMPGSSGEGGKAVENYARFFRSIYGDICYEQTSTGDQKIKYRLPLLSVPQQISVFRDGPGTACPEGFLYCPITQSALEKGICPSFNEVLTKVKNNTLQSEFQSRPTETTKLWIESTLSAVLNVSHYEAVAKMAESPSQENHRQQRWIETFCDASAVNAYKKLHLRMMTIALDHLLLNRKINDQDRASVRQMMNRVTDYLELGLEDSRSKVDQMLVGLEVESDRRKEALRGSTMASAEASNSLSQQLGEIMPGFGGVMHIGQ